MTKKIKISDSKVKALYNALATYRNGYPLLPSEIKLLEDFNITI